MSLADSADFWSQIRQIAREEAHKSPDGGSTLGTDGVIADGSWNPKDGTVSVWLTESASLLPSDTEQPLLYQGIQLATTVPGHQGPPIGGERVILLRRHSGFIALLEHGLAAGTNDDSPGTPAGEAWYQHPKTKSYQKFKNSGNIDTSANQAWTVEAGTIASIIAPEVQIGPPGGPYLNVGGGGDGSGFAIVRVSDLSALLTYIATHTHSGVQGGSSNSGAPTSAPPPITGAPNATAD